MNNQEDKQITVTLQAVSLRVADVDRSVEFYTKLPGAELVMHHPGRFAKIKFGGAHIQVVKLPAEESSFHIELDTANQQALYKELLSRGIEPDSPPTLQPHGRINFSVHDPDGYVLEFDTP